MIATIFWSILGAFALLAIISLAWVTAEDDAFRPTDVLIVIAPFIVWLLLLFIWHPPDLLNLFEPFVLVPVIGICLAARAFGFGTYSHTVRSLVALAFSMTFAVAWYGFVQVLLGGSGGVPGL